MKLFPALCALIVVLATRCESIDFKDIGKSVVDVAKGVANKIPEVIPNPEEFFQSAKNVIAGYPFDVAFRAINQFCENSRHDRTQWNQIESFNRT